jgi:hypothetical protein
MVIGYHENGQPVCGLCDLFIEDGCQCWCLDCKRSREACMCYPPEPLCRDCRYPASECDCPDGPLFGDDEDYDEDDY